MKVLFFWCTLIGLDLVGQIPFANALQIPLLLNPSFAGNKDKHRIQCAWNSNGSKDYKNKAYHLSYDNFSKSLRMGYGVYGLYTHQQAPSIDNDHTRDYRQQSNGANGAQYNYFKHEILREKFPDKWLTYKVGVCVASKHNVRSKGTESKRIGTFSPSLAIDILERQVQYLVGGVATKRQHPDTVLVGQIPHQYQTILREDSMSYAHNIARDRGFYTQVGLKYNNSYLMVMYSFGYGVEYSQEINYLWSTKPKEDYISTITEGKRSERNYKHRYITHKFTVGCSYPKDPDAATGIAVLASIGTIKYKIMSPTITPLYVFDSHLDYKKFIPAISHLHMSTILRHRKLLFTANYTRYNWYQMYGLGIGFQNSHYRCMATFMPQVNNMASTMELTLGIYI